MSPHNSITRRFNTLDNSAQTVDLPAALNTLLLGPEQPMSGYAFPYASSHRN
jgi:hypothetical protein